MNPPMPAFIGNFRSGTTLLINLLGLHDAIAPWFETKGLCEALRWLRVLNHPDLHDLEAGQIRLPGPDGFSATAVAERMLFDFRATTARILGTEPSGKGNNERYPVGYDHALYRLAEAEAAVAAWLQDVDGVSTPERVAQSTGRLIRSLGERHAQLADKPLWINKTPEVVRFGAELRACLGPCRMILMLRDGRAVLRSAMRLGWAEPAAIAAWWQGMIEQSRLAAAEDSAHYLEVRYESLVADPVHTLNQVLEFLGLEPTAEALVQRYQQDYGLSIAPPAEPSQYDATLDSWLDRDFMKALGYV